MRGLLRGSLFWTIAATFLLMAIVGTLIQALVVSAVLQPLEERETRARAELTASAIAVAIAASPGTYRGAALDSLLARHRAAVRPAWIFYRASDGTVVTSPPGRFFGRPGGAGPDSLLRPPPPPGTARESRGRFEALAKRTVAREGEVLGEVQVVRRTWPKGAFSVSDPRTWLLLFPVAIAASAIAGLVLVRLLVRRLRAVEVLATRVAEGDLSVRIADRSGDEIG